MIFDKDILLFSLITAGIIYTLVMDAKGDIYAEKSYWNSLSCEEIESLDN
jgi:hypothetical protein